MNGSADAIVTFNQRDFAAAMESVDFGLISPATALLQIRSPDS
jgi:hypothetical protein